MAEMPGKTFMDLQEIFELHTGISGEIDSADLVMWLNEAQVDLAIFFELDMPTLLSGADADQISELPAVLHDLLPLWATSRYWDRESEGDSEESGHGTKWMAYYLQQRDLRKSFLNLKGTKPERWIIVDD